MTHPLTDEICELLDPEHQWSDVHGNVVFRHSDMRAAWDKGADWQLEQDAEAWRIILNRMKILHPLIVDSIIEEFKQAMRPQQ